MEDNEFKINGVPITLLKPKQVEAEIRKRGGKIPTNSVKDGYVSQLRDILKDEQKQTSSSKKRMSNGELSNVNKKVAIGDPKALQLEKKILNGFNFYPIVERLKFDELGFRLVKEYTRFIVIKILTHDTESVKTLPPPLIGRIWISHILDTNRYEELCNLIELKIHHNPDGFEEVPQQVKRERYEKTLELYEQYFTKSSKDPEIWESDYLLYDEEDNDDDDYDDDDEEEEELQQQQQQQEEVEEKEKEKLKEKEKEKENENEKEKEKETEKEKDKEKEKEKDKDKEKDISIKNNNDKKQKEIGKETDKKLNSDIENKNNSNGIKQISKEETTTATTTTTTTTPSSPASTPQKVLIPTKFKNAPATPSTTSNTQPNLNGESTSTTASVASDNSPNKQPTINTPSSSSSSKHQKQPQTPNTPSSATSSTTQQQPQQQTPSSSKPVRNGEHKISIGFVSLKSQKKEITTFHGVGLTKSLFKVIKAYSKLKNVEISSVRFLYNGNPILNETPTDLGMKDGDTITVQGQQNQQPNTQQPPPPPSSSSSTLPTPII
ncbi:hypothetical protein ACTFIW_007757 [Dictyostelium discoideum]